MAQQSLQNEHAAPIAANLGVARPPIIYLTAIVAGLVLHFVWPIPFVSGLAMPFGALTAVFAATLFVWSIRTFSQRARRCPGIDPLPPSSQSGPTASVAIPSISRSRCFRLESRLVSTTSGS